MNCLTKDQVTIKVLKEVSNSIVSFFELTAEVTQGPDQPIACLDTQIWYGYPRSKWIGLREA